MVMDQKKPSMRDVNKSKSKSRLSLVSTIKRSSKRDSLNYKEESESSRLEVHQRSKSLKLRIESPMPSMPLEQLSMKELL